MGLSGIFVVIFAIFALETACYVRFYRLNTGYSWAHAEPPLLWYKKQSNDLVETELAQIVTPSIGEDVNKLLEDMSLQDKYSLLLQSYGGKVLESTQKDDSLFVKMEDLFSSMIKKALYPDDRSTQFFLDAASSYCNIDTMSRALRLTKAGVRLLHYMLDVFASLIAVLY
jgi:hypothetical protein